MLSQVTDADHQPRVRSFADIPGELRRRVGAGERVVLVLLDALGLGLLMRERDHPLVRRLELTPLDSQFPSTTTAHVTTIHSGLPVAEHGLYEWAVYEPELDGMISPLPFMWAGSRTPGDLAGRLDPRALAPWPSFFATLGTGSLVLQPRAIVFSPFSRATLGGAGVAGFDTLPEGLASLADALRDTDLRLAYLYWPQIDAVGHRHGPSSAEFRAAARSALDALSAAAPALAKAGATVLVTADHGQVDVDPRRVDYLDAIWPELPSMLTQPRPAGSARDAFLHVAPGSVDAVIDGLAQRLGDRARVCRAAELFPAIGDRLAARLADVAVLPAPGREAWLRAAAGPETWMRGQHGGLEPAETATYLAAIDVS